MDDVLVDLSVEPPGGHSAENTARVAAALAEATRVLNYATLPQNVAQGAPWPDTISNVVGSLAIATSRLPQLAKQLGDRLATIDHEAGPRVYVAYGLNRGDPKRAVDDALYSLRDVAATAEALSNALTLASMALGPIGIREE